MNTRERSDFLDKVFARRYKTAQVVENSQFVKILDSWTECENAYFAIDSGDGVPQVFNEKDLTNFCF